MNYRVNEDIRIIREMLNISQEQLSIDIDMDRKTIYRIENVNTYPTDDTIEKIYNYSYNKKIKLNQIKEMFYKEEYTNKIIFHGSKSNIEGEISPSYGRNNNDFGKGFYCGESYDQTTSFIAKFPKSSVYVIKFDDKNLKKAVFEVNQEWMLAIAYYRGRLEEYKNHPIIKNIIKKIENVDYVYAPIADNRMFRIIDQFIDGFITDEQCKHCLAATNLGNQYVFLTDKATKQLEILEKCYICEAERSYYENIKEADLKDGDNKVKMAMIKYKREGKYIEEILK